MVIFNFFSGVDPADIGIIAPYRQQIAKMRQILKSLELPVPKMNKSSLEIISNAPIKLNYGWFVEMVNLEISSWVVLDKEETCWLFIHQ